MPQRRAAVATFLARHQPRVNLLTSFSEDAQAPLHTAAFVGSVDACEALLRAGAHVNLLTSKGISPLLKAVSRGWANRPATVARLLRAHADPDVGTLERSGYGPLHAA